MKFSTPIPILLAVALSLGACQTCNRAGRAEAGEDAYLVNTDRRGVALEGGHDPVSFFLSAAPLQGSSRWQTRHGGATYWFSSQQNLDAFEADPERYTPAYGGYCGYAASIDRLSPVSVEYFQILDGRLVLQHNERAFRLWNEDVPGNLDKADSNWPGLIERNGRGERVLVNVDKQGVALEGHDPVAYFTEHRPVPGKAEFEAHFNGAVYHFVSKENRVTFEDAPEHYAPAFGGFCGYAASIDKVSPVNIHIFQIIDERLVLQHTPKAYRLFNDDAQASLARADRYWPGLVACKGK